MIKLFTYCLVITSLIACSYFSEEAQVIELPRSEQQGLINLNFQPQEDTNDINKIMHSGDYLYVLTRFHPNLSAAHWSMGPGGHVYTYHLKTQTWKKFTPPEVLIGRIRDMGIYNDTILAMGVNGDLYRSFNGEDWEQEIIDVLDYCRYQEGDSLGGDYCRLSGLVSYPLQLQISAYSQRVDRPFNATEYRVVFENNKWVEKPRIEYEGNHRKLETDFVQFSNKDLVRDGSIFEYDGEQVKKIPTPSEFNYAKYPGNLGQYKNRLFFNSSDFVWSMDEDFNFRREGGKWHWRFIYPQEGLDDSVSRHTLQRKWIYQDQKYEWSNNFYTHQGVLFHFSPLYVYDDESREWVMPMYETASHYFDHNGEWGTAVLPANPIFIRSMVGVGDTLYLAGSIGGDYNATEGAVYKVPMSSLKIGSKDPDCQGQAPEEYSNEDAKKFNETEYYCEKWKPHPDFVTE